MPRYKKTWNGDVWKAIVNIRTNAEISSFIKRFVNKKDNVSQRKYKNITIQNFEKIDCENCNEIPIKSHNIHNHDILTQLKNNNYQQIII